MSARRGSDKRPSRHNHIHIHITDMKILYVCNNAFILGNGISTSARNITQELIALGEDVRLMSSENPDPDGPQPYYRLRKLYFPIFQPIIDANGFCYARIDRKIIREAVTWADIVHIEEPLFLEKAAIREAERQGKPVTGTFHMYTQNVLSEIPLCNNRLFNHLLMCDWRNNFYDRCTDVQCPSQAVRSLLERKSYKSRLHVISNGIRIPEERVAAKPYPQGKPWLIASIGRLADVKNQSLLLEAMRYSRHAAGIRLYFAGNGQMEGRYRRMAAMLVSEGVLRYEPVFAFLEERELKALASASYLVVHAAKMEVEGLGCIEAIREGTVPLIARGELIATSGFALDERSTFDVNDPKSLAEGIDYWIEHPDERDIMAQQYADHAREYDIRKSAEELIGMYRLALTRHDEK